MVGSKEGEAIVPRFDPHSRSHFIIPLGSTGVIERITVIGTIPNNSSGLSHGDNFIEGSLDKGDFMRASRIRVHGVEDQKRLQ